VLRDRKSINELVLSSVENPTRGGGGGERWHNFTHSVLMELKGVGGGEATPKDDISLSILEILPK
jgi:hypothetical protein